MILKNCWRGETLTLKRTLKPLTEVNLVIGLIKKVIKNEVCGRSLTKGKNFEVLSEDMFIVSYPKSGNTWTRFLLANLFFKDVDVDFNNIDSLIPDIYTNSNKTLSKIKNPRFIKSHESFDPRYKRIIYIVRDPRDVLISYYYYHLKFRRIDDSISLDEYVPLFLRGEFDDFGTWQENVESWISTKLSDPKFIVVRYEDLLLNTSEIVQEITTKFNLGLTFSDIKRAVDLSSFEEMKKKENYHRKWKFARNDISFVRSGKSGSWRNELSTETSNLIIENWGDTMRKFNYC